MPNTDLLAYLSDNTSPLRADLATWLLSKRWETFATVHRDKIRKKLRETRDPAALADLRAELETAYLLLGEPRLNVVYEPLGRSHGPAPDYAVSYTTSLTVMLEVTRLRDLERLGDVVAAKLRQLVPGYGNVLLVWLAVEPQPLPDKPQAPDAGPDLAAAMQRLKQRVESGDQLLLERARSSSRSDFISRLGQLNELIVRLPGPALGRWSNPAARNPLPARIAAAITRALEGQPT